MQQDSNLMTPRLLSNHRTHNEGSGRSKSRHPAADLRNVCDRVCVCVTLGDGDVRELGAQAGVCSLRACAQCQCDCGGLADPCQPALPHVRSLHQTSGPWCGQVCNMDTSECFHWTSWQLANSWIVFPTSSLLKSGCGWLILGSPNFHRVQSQPGSKEIRAANESVTNLYLMM